MRVNTQPLFALLALGLAVAPSTSLARGNNGLPVWHDQSYASIQDATRQDAMRGGAPSRAVARGVDQTQLPELSQQAETLIQQLRQDQDTLHALVHQPIGEQTVSNPARLEEVRALSARIIETRRALDDLRGDQTGTQG